MGRPRAGGLDLYGPERELTGGNAALRSRDLGEHALDVDAAVGGPVRREAARCFLELPLAPRLVLAARVVPRDGNVDEALQEVSLRAGRFSPFVLELLVRLEVRAGPDQLEPSFQAHSTIIRVRERC